MLALPVKPALVERKGRVEVVVVRLVDVAGDWSSETPFVEANHTYARASGKPESFSSFSGYRGKTDEEVLWDVVRSVYHSW